MFNKELNWKNILEAADKVYCDPIMVNGGKLSCFDCVIGECETWKYKYEPVGF